MSIGAVGPDGRSMLNLGPVSLGSRSAWEAIDADRRAKNTRDYYTHMIDENLRAENERRAATAQRQHKFITGPQNAENWTAGGGTMETYGPLKDLLDLHNYRARLRDHVTQWPDGMSAPDMMQGISLFAAKHGQMQPTFPTAGGGGTRGGGGGGAYDNIDLLKLFEEMRKNRAAEAQRGQANMAALANAGNAQLKTMQEQMGFDALDADDTIPLAAKSTQFVDALLQAVQGGTSTAGGYGGIDPSILLLLLGNQHGAGGPAQTQWDGNINPVLPKDPAPAPAQQPTNPPDAAAPVAAPATAPTWRAGPPLVPAAKRRGEGGHGSNAPAGWKPTPAATPGTPPTPTPAKMSASAVTNAPAGWTPRPGETPPAPIVPMPKRRRGPPTPHVPLQTPLYGPPQAGTAEAAALPESPPHVVRPGASTTGIPANPRLTQDRPPVRGNPQTLLAAASNLVGDNAAGQLLGDLATALQQEVDLHNNPPALADRQMNEPANPGRGGTAAAELTQMGLNIGALLSPLLGTVPETQPPTPPQSVPVNPSRRDEAGNTISELLQAEAASGAQNAAAATQVATRPTIPAPVASQAKTETQMKREWAKVWDMIEKGSTQADQTAVVNYIRSLDPATQRFIRQQIDDARAQGK